MKKLSLKFSKPTLWAILLTSPIPFILITLNFIFSLQNLELLDTEIERVYTKIGLIQETAQKESSVLSSLKNPDPDYLGKYVESLTFQLSEIKKFETIQGENPDDELTSKRLLFLKGGGNRLIFSEEQIRSNEIFRETEEKQQNLVEMNEEDLKKILCLVEGLTIWPYGPKEGRPQLIFKDFKLSKKETSSQEKVFVVSMQLIKRENL